LGARGGLPVGFGAARRSFGQRALGGGRQRFAGFRSGVGHAAKGLSNLSVVKALLVRHHGRADLLEARPEHSHIWQS
jgi:hypothetical protein